jgi:hypothetical protein
MKMKFLIILLSLFPLYAHSASEMSELLCPRASEKFLQLSKNNFLNMEDLVKTKLELRQAYEDLYFFMLEKPKDKGLLEEIKNIESTVSSVEQKRNRAKDNYNRVALDMGSYLTKTKKCWGQLSKDQKQKVSMLFSYILKEKRLLTFKSCMNSMDKTSAEAKKQYVVALELLNKKTEEKKLIESGKISQAKIKKLKEEEEKNCLGMNKDKYYEDQIKMYFFEK